MKLTLAEHGGLAAGLRLGHPPVVVDMSILPDADVRQLTDLLSAARADPAPSGSARTVPDAMSYTVTVEDDGRQEVLRRTDTTMSREFAELLDRLRHLASTGG
jgi:hypothetical protein